MKQKPDSRPTLGAQDQGNHSLAQALRRQYLDIQDEPIPSRLQKLIDALKEVERNEKDGD